MNLYQHYLEFEFGSQRSMRNMKQKRENGHQTLIQRGHSVKRTCPFRYGRVEENKLIPLYKNNEHKLKHFFVQLNITVYYIFM